MKWLDGYRIRLVLLGIVAAVVFSNSTNVMADFIFGEATSLEPPINTPRDNGGRLSFDELTFYLNYYHRPGGYGGADFWISTRSTTEDPWSEPVNLGSTVNSSSDDFNPAITSDELELYFCSDRPGGYGSNDIWVTRRETKDSPWSQPIALDPPTNGWQNVWGLSISPDALELFFVSYNIPGGYGKLDIWIAKRATREAPWGEPVNAGPNVNSSERNNGPMLLPDGLTLIFSSDRLGGFSTSSNLNFDLWLARRKTKDSPWGEAVNLGSSINTPRSDFSSCISADGRMLYFSDEGFRPGGQGGQDILQAPIIPIVDINNDGIVDAADMCIMVDNWGTDEPLCDIGPTPFGDGVVDVQDLIVLAEHLFEEIEVPAN